MWKWLLDDLPAVIKSINPDININWGALNIFGVSWGGQMALKFWLAALTQDYKIDGLCVRKVVLRCPVTKEYRRKPGLYVGEHISQERADADSERVLDMLADMPWKIPRWDSKTPDMTYTAPVFSIAHRFHSLCHHTASLHERTSPIQSALTSHYAPLCFSPCR